MVKFYKKAVPALAAALVLGNSFSVFASASDVNADDILKKMINAEKQEENVSVDADMKMNLNMEIGDGESKASVGMAIGGGFEVKANLGDEKKSEVKGDFSVETAGEKTNMQAEAYVVEEDDGFHTYSKFVQDDVEERWQASVVDKEKFQSQIDALASIGNLEEYLKDAGVEFEVVEDGNQYVLSTSLEKEEISALIDQSIKEVEKIAKNMNGEDTSGEDASIETVEEDAEIGDGDLDSQVDFIEGYLDGVVVDIDLSVDKDTYLPVSMSVDLSNCDFNKIGEIVALQAGVENAEVKVSADNTYIKADYNFAPVEIEVPEEAVNASRISSLNKLN